MKKTMRRPMKMVVSMLLVLGLMAGTVTALVACGGEKFKVDIFSFNQSDPYIGQVVAELQEEIKTAIPNASVKVFDGGDNQATQKNDIDTVISRGSDLLLVNIVNNAQGEDYAKTIKKSGIPVVFFNREIENKALEVDSTYAYVGTDPTAAGVMQGQMIGEMIPDADAFAKYNNNDSTLKIDYVMFRADPTNPEANGRTKYSVEEGNKQLRANLGAEFGEGNLLNSLYEDQMCSWSTKLANEAMTSLLGKSNISELDLIIANNDGMAQGVIAALQEAGFNLPGSKTTGVKYIPVFGVDALSGAVKLIEDGCMEGTVKQDAVAMAKSVVQIALNLKDAKDIKTGTDVFGTWDEGVNKLRIPYAKVS